jgi:hypothetical protein
MPEPKEAPDSPRFGDIKRVEYNIANFNKYSAKKNRFEAFIPEDEIPKWSQESMAFEVVEPKELDGTLDKLYSESNKKNEMDFECLSCLQIPPLFNRTICCGIIICLKCASSI